MKPGLAGCCSRDAALANRIRCTYREGEKVPFSVTLSEPFFGEFVTENVIRTFSPSLLVHLIRLYTAALREQQPANPGFKIPRHFLLHPCPSPSSGPRTKHNPGNHLRKQESQPVPQSSRVGRNHWSRDPQGGL